MAEIKASPKELGTRALAAPPWPAALLIGTRGQGNFAVTLSGPRSLALVPCGRASAPDTGRPPELAIPDESLWLMGYLESRLGPSQEKEYRVQPAPRHIEMPGYR